MSLIPEKMLSISPSLAATIGLEEAVLLHALNELSEHNGQELIDNYTLMYTDEILRPEGGKIFSDYKEKKSNRA